MSIMVNDLERPWHRGMNVEELLSGIEGTFHMAVVRVNGTMVSRHERDSTLIPDGAVVDIVDMIAGG